MSTITVTLQDVNGDPYTTGSNINITTGTQSGAVFNEASGTVSLSTVVQNDTVTINGYTYDYDYLGAGDVRGDTGQPAAFIRIVSAPPGAPISAGATYAIDLSGQPGDPDYPNLQNGNTKLSVSDLDTSTPVQFPGIPCFVAGTLIECIKGPRPVEDIEPGDQVWTLDDGFQTVRWTGNVEVSAEGRFAPIEFASGAIGNRVPLRVSPQHRVLVQGWRSELYCGMDQVLVAACHLVSGTEVRRVSGGRVRYVHLLFDRHQIVETDGALSESLYVGTQSMSFLPDAAVVELLALFPDLENRIDRDPTVRSVARRNEAALLIAV
ncbi:Hint domain-containing protein [Nioella aestuarii]|uniref:Hint domain-containing protein n=1 Tax=Nioella aestuarii TaxID=1662864 RepID=UPI003D7FF138